MKSGMWAKAKHHAVNRQDSFLLHSENNNDLNLFTLDRCHLFAIKNVVGFLISGLHTMHYTVQCV